MQCATPTALDLEVAFEWGHAQTFGNCKSSLYVLEKLIKMWTNTFIKKVQISFERVKFNYYNFVLQNYYDNIVQLWYAAESNV